MMRRTLAGIGLTWALFAGAAPAFAQDDDAGTASSADPGTSRSAQFRAVHGAPREHVAGGPLLIAAYAVAWLLVLGYVARLGMMQARTRRDVERLERALADPKKAE